MLRVCLRTHSSWLDRCRPLTTVLGESRAAQQMQSSALATTHTGRPGVATGMLSMSVIRDVVERRIGRTKCCMSRLHVRDSLRDVCKVVNLPIRAQVLVKMHLCQ